MRKYESLNRKKYLLNVHIIFSTKYRKKILYGALNETIIQKIIELSKKYDWVIDAMNTDLDHIHILLGYKTTERICDIIKILKQETTYEAWHKYDTFLNRVYFRKKNLWADGYFVCSTGNVSSNIIQRYIENQG